MTESPSLDLSTDAATLTQILCDIESVSGNETVLADAIERALQSVRHLQVERDGDAVFARTTGGRPERVIVAGHIDTVPIADNLPCRVEGDRLYGCGTTDMKSGVAVALRLAAEVTAPTREVTWVFYDCEEVEATRNGLERVTRNHPDWLAADFAVLMEPTNATVEGGCQGSLRAEVTVRGHRAHSARSWHGSNAIHHAGEVLDRLRAYQAAEVEIDGLTYREGLNAVGISGGVAGNVIPDECTVSVNYRFAPDKSAAQAESLVRDLFAGFEVSLSDASPGALPGLGHPAAAAFVAAIGKEPLPKFGWTDVARFSALGVPAVNYGPGDPNVAHTREEYVAIPLIAECEDRMRSWLTA
ncbi:MAG: succinyl-diaminopimelate desuccinylase [Actinomycetota bacterium]|nr:succinyl-diaminopimelate desuccinylase [Actinomycetota bacterium]